MPRAPTYEPQVRDQGIGNARFTSDVPTLKVSDASAQISKDLGSAAGVASSFFQEQKKQNDQLAALDADNDLAKFSTDYLYNPDTGALNKKGRNAFGLSDDFDEKFRAKTDEIESKLSNPDQRLAFEKIKQSRYQDVDKQLQRHISVEGHEFDNEVTKSSLNNEREAAASAYLDNERIGQSLERQKSAIFDYAQRNGMPSEWVQDKLLDTVSKTHASVLARMVMTPGKELLAKDYFSKLEVGKDITEEDSKSMFHLVHESSIRGESQHTADDIFASAKDRAAALKEVGQRYKDNSELRHATEQRIDYLYSEKDRARSEQENNLYRLGSGIIEGYLKTGQQVVARDVVPPGVWNQLSPEAQKALETKGKETETDHQKWLDFTFLSQGQLANLNEMDYDTKYRSHFGPQEQKTADGLIRAAKTGDDKNQLLTNFSVVRDRLDATLRANKIVDPSNPKKKDADAELYSKLDLEARKRIEDFETNDLQGKRRATGEEIQKILDDMILKGKVQQPFWRRDTEKPISVMTTEEKAKAYIPMKEIPEASKEALSRRMKELNKKVTDDKIQRAYFYIRTGDKENALKVMTE